MSRRVTLKELVEIWGWDEAASLLARFGGDKVYLPQLRSLERARRNSDLIRDFDAGVGYDELSRRYNVSPSHARMIVSRRNVVPFVPKS